MTGLVYVFFGREKNWPVTRSDFYTPYMHPSTAIHTHDQIRCTFIHVAHQPHPHPLVSVIALSACLSRGGARLSHFQSCLAPPVLGGTYSLFIIHVWDTAAVPA